MTTMSRRLCCVLLAAALSVVSCAALASGAWQTLTPDMADDYISLSVPACVSELSALQTGGGFVDEIALAWS